MRQSILETCRLLSGPPKAVVQQRNRGLFVDLQDKSTGFADDGQAACITDVNSNCLLTAEPASFKPFGQLAGPNVSACAP